MIKTEPVHHQKYCYLIELTGNMQTDLLVALSAAEQNLGDWECIYSAKLPTWRLWTNANADVVRYTVSHIIARCSLPQNAYCLTQYRGHDQDHPKRLHPQFPTH